MRWSYRVCLHDNLHDNQKGFCHLVYSRDLPTYYSKEHLYVWWIWFKKRTQNPRQTRHCNPVIVTAAQSFLFQFSHSYCNPSIPPRVLSCLLQLAAYASFETIRSYRGLRADLCSLFGELAVPRRISNNPSQIRPATPRPYWLIKNYPSCWSRKSLV